MTLNKKTIILLFLSSMLIFPLAAKEKINPLNAQPLINAIIFFAVIITAILLILRFINKDIKKIKGESHENN